MMGFRGKYKNKRDENEPDIVAQIEAHGVQVIRADKPLDLICGYGGQTFLLEIKNGPKAPLTVAQEDFLSKWSGHAEVITSIEAADQWARSLREAEE